jgi:hypothetical protein
LESISGFLKGLKIPSQYSVQILIYRGQPPAPPHHHIL